MAWHDGNGKKLSGDFIWNWHLNREGSYSVSYLVYSLAFTKWMQDCFDRTLVAGLSQGGAAVMLNVLQSEADLAIVASGSSVINDLAEWSGHSQLIGVPGYGALSSPEYLVDRLKQSPAQWFFSWGKQEIGTYRIEAEEQRTAEVIRMLPNVTTAIHDEGHVFSIEAIAAFLKHDNTQRNIEGNPE